MHLLGNVWGQKWDLGDKVKPFRNAPKLDVSRELINQGYTPKKLFEASEDFYVSINLTKMPDSFWKNSIIEKPNDGRDMICHASAWDFLINDDVRIKQCTRVSMESFITIHHEVNFLNLTL
jgi:peptidyl-dipeptidase A